MYWKNGGGEHPGRAGVETVQPFLQQEKVK
jgi:hypothetical protein